MDPRLIVGAALAIIATTSGCAPMPEGQPDRTTYQTTQQEEADGCTDRTDLEACNEAGCAWYDCNSSCHVRGSDQDAICAQPPSQTWIDRCRAVTEPEQCDAAGCGWYWCNNTCHAHNEASQEAICAQPPSQTWIDRCRAIVESEQCDAAGCGWYWCNNTCHAHNEASEETICAQPRSCPWGFSVQAADADRPEDRARVMQAFQSRHSLQAFGDLWSVLSGEIAFVDWMRQTGRLSSAHRGNWYDVADTYLTASRFAGERLAAYLQSGDHCADAQLGRLQPGVAEWALFVLLAERAQAAVALLEPWLLQPVGFGGNVGLSAVLQMSFWLAHNAALRHGVWLADIQHLRDRTREPAEEGDLTNIILYTVLEPGDRCAAGNMGFCVMTFPVFERVGLTWYPRSYPATRAELDTLLSRYYIFDAGGRLMTAGLSLVYGMMAAMGARMPSNEHHCLDPAVNVVSPCVR